MLVPLAIADAPGEEPVQQLLQLDVDRQVVFAHCLRLPGLQESVSLLLRGQGSWLFDVRCLCLHFRFGAATLVYFQSAKLDRARVILAKDLILSTFSSRETHDS